jgi:hypothetical protein
MSIENGATRVLLTESVGFPSRGFDSRRLHQRFHKQDAEFITRPAFLCLQCAHRARFKGYLRANQVVEFLSALTLVSFVPRYVAPPERRAEAPAAENAAHHFSELPSCSRPRNFQHVTVRGSCKLKVSSSDFFTVD